MNRRDDIDRCRRVRVERGVYRQPNGKYAVCFMLDGKPRFRTVDGDLDAARSARARLAIAAQAGLLPACPRLTFATVAARWLDRFETMVAVGERRLRTLESHRYHLDRHLLPALGRRRIATLTVDDIAGLIGARSARTRSPGWAACLPRYRLLIVTALYTGMRISELLALCWADVDFGAGVIHVRAQLSRAHHGTPAQRVAPKTAAAVRDIPLIAQLASLLRDQRQTARFAESGDFVFATGNGTPLGHRNVESRALQRAAAAADLEAVRFHDLRHTFASHLIIDLGLDVAQVSRFLGHATVATTLNIYTHLFDDVRHATEIRARMAASPFARLLEPDDTEADNVVAIARRPARRPAARRRALARRRT